MMLVLVSLSMHQRWQRSIVWKSFHHQNFNKNLCLICHLKRQYFSNFWLTNLLLISCCYCIKLKFQLDALHPHNIKKKHKIHGRDMRDVVMHFIINICAVMTRLYKFYLEIRKQSPCTSAPVGNLREHFFCWRPYDYFFFFVTCCIYVILNKSVPKKSRRRINSIGKKVWKKGFKTSSQFVKKNIQHVL